MFSYFEHLKESTDLNFVLLLLVLFFLIFLVTIVVNSGACAKVAVAVVHVRKCSMIILLWRVEMLTI